MTDENENIELKCPGGRCPIKNICSTYEPDIEKTEKISLKVPPFKQEGIVVKCHYFKLNPIVQKQK